MHSDEVRSYEGKRIVIAGASGLIGRAVVARLKARGAEVVRLVRRPPAGPDEASWNPGAGMLNPAVLEGVDAVINLSGANVGAGRWSSARRSEIRISRLDATETLVRAIGTLDRRPAVFVSASAVGYYGDCGDAVVDESCARGRGFLAEVCEAWEASALTAQALGVRTVPMRLGVVLAPKGGALEKMLPFFRLGIGGRLGDGRQWMSWLSIEDAVRAFCHVMDEPRCSGPINLVAPNPVTNAEFTAALGKVLHRPTVLPVPRWVLKTALGRMAEETVLSSTRAVPRKLEANGFGFRHVRVEEALRAVLEEREKV